MPQLNPAPWFVTLLFSWFILLTIIPPKIMAHTFPHEPNLQDFKKTMTESWNWPWY